MAKKSSTTTPDEAKFNIKAVVQETGLKPDTLRAWERRYGLPQPRRTNGGHRLYTRRDINIVKWLIARQEEGLIISRAIDLWHKLKTEGKDPLQQPLTRGPSARDESALHPPGGDTIARLRQAWVSACLAFGELGAEQALTEALALYPVEKVCTELLQTGLAEIGRQWHQGKVSAQQEHFASGLAIRKLESLLASSPTATRPEVVLLGCPPEEEHVFSPLLLTLFLRRRGWDTVYLGANVPVARMQATIASVKPNLIILSAQYLPTAATLLEIGQVIFGANVPMAFGGLIFNHLPNLRSHIPGYFLGERLEQGAEQAEQYLARPKAYPPVEAAKKADSSYKQALALYREKQGLIEADVWQLLRHKNEELLPNYMANANKNLSRNIVAALSLGDLTFLDPEAIWVDEMLGHYRLSEGVMPQYLQAYFQAAQKHLDGQAQPLIECLARLTGD